MDQSYSSEGDNHSAGEDGIRFFFSKLECSLPYSQELALCPYRMSNESSAHSSTQFL
jgi:hypothetical protein